MLKKKDIAILAFFASFSLTGFGSAFAEDVCKAPKMPSFPNNGAIISYEKLMEFADQVSAYSKSNTAYKTCLDRIITQPANVSRERWRTSLKAYNETAPAEQAVWSSYQRLSDDWVAANKAK